MPSEQAVYTLFPEDFYLAIFDEFIGSFANLKIQSGSGINGSRRRCEFYANHADTNHLLT